MASISGERVVWVENTAATAINRRVPSMRRRYGRTLIKPYLIG
jgi:hypothetical protein